MGFTLTDRSTLSMTQISDIFIDEYMPHANGSFVKVYLFLLRQLHSDSPVQTIETMADMLSNTEADIIRALRYWQKQGLLSITETDGNITSLCLLPLSSETAATEEVNENSSSAGTSLSTPPAPKSAAADTDGMPDSGNIVSIVPKRHTYSPLQAEALKKDAEIESCLSMAEAMLGTTLGESHMQLILYLMSDLGFSSDLVITLYETALSRGKNKPRYIEAIALDWAKKGIRTPKEAEKEVSSFHGTYRTVSSALGIKRALAPAEMRIIDKWETFHFPAEVIEEACSRTVLQSGDTNLNYTSKILEDWHKKGVTCLKDIEECDRSYFRQKTASQTSAKEHALSKKKNNFQNFPQRDYSPSDYEDLERQLLHQ